MLLPLCIFLSSGFAHLDGQGIAEKLGHFLTETTFVGTNADTLCTFNGQHQLTVRASTHASSEGDHLPDIILKEQKDETDTSQKSISPDGLPAENIFFQCLYSVKKKQLLFSKRLSHFPTYKSLYLLFEVFRI